MFLTNRCFDFMYKFVIIQIEDGIIIIGSPTLIQFIDIIVEEGSKVENILIIIFRNSS